MRSGRIEPGAGQGAGGAPSESLGGRGLRAALYVGGTVATIAGLHTVIAGARSLPGQAAGNRAVESELRFYAAFYAAYGIAALRVAPRADRDAIGVRVVAGTLFLAGLARAGGWLAVGKPHPVQRGLLAAELALPPLLVAWQARVSHSHVLLQGTEGPKPRLRPRRSPR